MGVYANLQAQGKSFKSDSPLGRWLSSQIAIVDKIDPPASAQGGAVNAVHTLSAGDRTTGTFTLTVTLRNGETFTTAGIAATANAATVETAIDTAANGVVTGWTDGDISVSGGAVGTAPTVLTFDGTSVAGANHPLSSIDAGSLSGGTTDPAFTLTTAGQTARPAWDVLLALDVISGTLPSQTAGVTTVTAGGDLTDLPTGVLRDIAVEAAFEDNNQYSYFTIMNTFQPNDRAPGVERIDPSTS